MVTGIPLKRCLGQIKYVCGLIQAVNLRPLMDCYRLKEHSKESLSTKYFRNTWLKMAFFRARIFKSLSGNT